MGIARDTDDVLYVASGISNSIVNFDTEGNYMGLLQYPDLTFPQGVVFDDKGHLFSISLNQNNIVEFDAAGIYVRTITEG